MAFPKYISEADKREAWSNLQAFCRAFDEVEKRHKQRELEKAAADKEKDSQASN